jgi:hypothetical protein
LDVRNIQPAFGGSVAGRGSQVDRGRGPQAAEDRAARHDQCRAVPPGDDRPGLRRREHRPSDRAAGPGGRGHRPRRGPPLQRDRHGQSGPRWAGGRPRRLGTDDEDFVAQTAATRPTGRSRAGRSANSPPTCAASTAVSYASGARRYAPCRHAAASPSVIPGVVVGVWVVVWAGVFRLDGNVSWLPGRGP